MALPTENMTATGNPYDPRHNAAPGRAAGGLTAGEETPEALRRRADILLDEMMLGAVDMAAGGPVAGQANGDSWTGDNWTGDNWTGDNWTNPDYAPGNSVANSAGNGGAYWASAGDAASGDAATGDGALGEAGAAEDLDEAAAAYDGITAPGAESNGYHAPAEPVTARPARQPEAGSAAGDAAGRQANSRLISAEERYAQVSSAQPAPGQPAPGQPVAAFSPGVAASDAYAPAAEAQPRQRPADFDPTAPSIVRRTAPTLASTMTVGARAASRSNLLPRSTEVDAQNAQQEINALMSAIVTSLPPGHESVERSRHLLNKAQNLLQSDPTRSAEVDYYLNQVRRIVQRSQQTQQWSELYRNRLTLYLWAWLLLALVVLASLAIYAGPLVEWAVGWFALPDATMAALAPLVIGGGFAGALGASLSALANMGRHKRQEFGYFDRKYGLRGLLLPLLGLLLGALLGGVWAAVYWFIGIDPTQATWALAAPILVAFLVGFAQEWMYGSR